MSVTAPNANQGIPVYDDQFIALPASGTASAINPGDTVIFSGNYIIASPIGSAAVKASAVGIALTRNPAYDWAGRQVVNSGVIVATHGMFRVSASFSGRPLLGVLAYSDATGSGVNSPSGVTGMGATWNTAAPTQISANPTGAPNLAMGQVVAWYNSGLGGTGQMDVRVWPNNPSYF